MTQSDSNFDFEEAFYAPPPPPVRRPRTQHPQSPIPYVILAAAALLVLFLLFSLLRGCSPSADSEETASPAVTETVPPTPTVPAEPPKPTEVPWNLILVNADHPLPEGFTVETYNLANGLKFSAQAYSALTTMLSDCQAAGLEPIVCSAYRSVERQGELFDNKVNSYMNDGLSYDEAYAAAVIEIAAPGTSEHSTGLAADICALSYQLLNEEQANTAEQQWLMEHCTEYGFVLRFPKDKEQVTGIIYEPWHYRYVGVEAAQEMKEKNLCLEEYIELYYDI